MEPRPPKPEPVRRTVLVVDGDSQSLRIVDVSLRRAGFDVHTATDGIVAASLIARTPPPDLVIADVDVPGLDGFELCRRAKAHPTNIPFVFLARPDTANRIKSVELGADDYLSKPVFVKEVVDRVSALLQRHERERLASGDTLSEHVAGSLGDLSMIDLLQTIAANGRSGVLHLRAAGGARGEVYFRKGAVVDAEVGRLSGADAVYRLLSWTDGRFEIEWRNIRRRDTVVLSAPALLMEGMRRLDEWTRQLQQLPPLETVFEVDYRLLAERLADIPDEVNGILRLFDGVRTTIQVIDDCGLSDLEALTVIGKLSHERLIRKVTAESPDDGDDDGKNSPELQGWLSQASGVTAPASAEAPFAAPADVDARLRRASDPPSQPRTTMSGHAVADRSAPAAIHPDRRDRIGEQRHVAEPRQIDPWQDPPRHDARPHAEAPGVPEPRPSDEPAVVIPFPTSSTPSARPAFAPSPSLSPSASLTSSPAASTVAGVPAATVAGEISNGVATTSTAPREASPPLTAVSVPRATDPGLGPLAAASPPASVLPPPVELPPATLPSPPVAMAAEPIRAPAPVVAAPATPAHTPGAARPASKVPELPFSDSASRWMTEGDEIHADRKSEVLEDLALPSRSRGLMLIAAVVVVAAGSFVALRALRGSRAPDPVVEKAAAPVPSPAVTPPGEATPAAAAAAGTPIAAPSPSPSLSPSPSSAAAAAPADQAGLPAAGTDNAAPPSAIPAKPSPAPAAGGNEAANPNAPVGEVAAGDPAQLLTACQTAFTAGRMKDATTACTAAVQANPESAKALSLLAHSEFNRSHRKEALSWADKAIKIDPRLADAYVIIGGVQQDAGRNAEAKAAYRKYLELAPKGQYAPDLRAIVDTL